MKLSVSLPDEDVAFIDEYAQRTGIVKRSSVLHRAIELLRMSEMEAAYGEAWDEWGASDDARLWDTTSADGIPDAPR